MLEGPAQDSHNIYITVNIIDDSNGRTVFNLPHPISVLPDGAITNNMGGIISSNDPNSAIMQDLNSGNVNLVARNSLMLSSCLNSGKVQISNEQGAIIRSFLIDKISSLTVSDMSSIKSISSALSETTSSIGQVSKSAVVSIFQVLHFFKSFSIFFTKHCKKIKMSHLIKNL